MRTTLAPLIRFIEDRPWPFVLGLVGIVTFLRLLLLPLYQSSLGPDEAQYWFWSREFDWGYYSKPPMIAWIIGLPTLIFGNHEWSVRLLSPLFIGGTALCIFASGRRLFGDASGIWSAVLWLLLPAVMLGTTIVTTDIPLLFFWSLGLLAVISLCEAVDDREAVRWSLILGGAIGFGFLSKYAMIYFVIGWGLAAVVSSYARRSWQGGKALWSIPVAGAIFAPNLMWNASHGFQTLSHTADNANWGSDLLNPEELFQFLGDQFGVVGPFLFGALIVGLVLWHRHPSTGGRAALLVSFMVPPLAIIMVQALISRAHANWAMTAYPAAIILLPLWLRQMKARWVMWVSVGLHAALGLFATTVFLDFGIADSLGRSNDVKRVRSWDVTAQQIQSASAGYDAVVVDEREIGAHLTWEWRKADVPLRMADLNQRPDNTYEHAMPFEPAAGEVYLLATQVPDAACAYYGFEVVTPVGQSFVDLQATRRGRKERTIDLYRLSGFDPARRPFPCEG